MKPLVTVLLPNYNESANVHRGILQDIVKYLAHADFASEILISDDGSTDDSLALIKQIAASHPQIRIVENKHAGKPYALRAGISAAHGRYVLLTDMDQSTPITELRKLLPFTNQGFRVVIGSRGASRDNSSFIRKYIISLGFLTVRRLILLPEIKDTQCGFKLIETTLAKQIFSHMRIFGRVNRAVGWKVTAYDVELLYLAKKMGNIWKNEDVSSGKSRNFVKESIEMFLEILRVRINDMLGKYEHIVH